MPLIAACVEPDCVTRIFFDMGAAGIDPADERRIALTIEQASATPKPEPERLPRAA